MPTMKSPKADVTSVFLSTSSAFRVETSVTESTTTPTAFVCKVNNHDFFANALTLRKPKRFRRSMTVII